jgi:hypothetical protein
VSLILQSRLNGRLSPLLHPTYRYQAATAVQLQIPLLQQNLHLEAYFFAPVLGKTAVFGKIPLLPGLGPHQHFGQAAAGELTGILANYIQDSLLYGNELRHAFNQSEQ